VLSGSRTHSAAGQRTGRLERESGIPRRGSSSVQWSSWGGDPTRKTSDHVVLFRRCTEESVDRCTPCKLLPTEPAHCTELAHIVLPAVDIVTMTGPVLLSPVGAFCPTAGAPVAEMLAPHRDTPRVQDIYVPEPGSCCAQPGSPDPRSCCVISGLPGNCQAEVPAVETVVGEVIKRWPAQEISDGATDRKGARTQKRWRLRAMIRKVGTSQQKLIDIKFNADDECTADAHLDQLISLREMFMKKLLLEKCLIEKAFLTS
jgi:hypothetical protein